MTRNFLTALLGLVLLWVAGCATVYPPAPPIAEQPGGAYLIGPGDSINVVVWRNPEVSMVVPVRPDVKLGDYRNFPFGPEIEAVDDAKVEKVIDELVAQNATLAPVGLAVALTAAVVLPLVFFWPSRWIWAHISAFMANDTTNRQG